MRTGSGGPEWPEWRAVRALRQGEANAVNDANTLCAPAATLLQPLVARVGVATAARARAMQEGGWDINFVNLLRQDCQWLAARADVDAELAAGARALAAGLDPGLRNEHAAIAAAVDALAHAGSRLLARAPVRRALRGDPARAETPPLDFVLGRMRRAHARAAIDTKPVAEAGRKREEHMSHTEDKPPVVDSARTQGSASPSVDIGAVRRVYHLADASVLGCELDAWLDAAGAELETLAEPDELLELLGALPPDLVVVDSGHGAALEAIGEAVQTARQNLGGRLQLAAMFDRDDLDTRLRARRAGVDHALFAPGSVGDVVSAIFGTSGTAPYRVLIVEDDRAQAIFAESVLRNAGMVARVVEDPLSVMQTLSEFLPDLVLMDLHMPKCNGMELTALIRERPEHLLTPIVFLSGESDQDIQFEVIGAGADDFIAKPVRPRHLIAAVQNRIQRARARAADADASSGVSVSAVAESGLLHREGFMRELQSAVAAGVPVGGLAFIEVEGARRVRDRFGLAAVEALLAEAARVLRANVPEPALAARLGDASFLVLDRSSRAAQLTAWAQALRAALMQHPFAIDGAPMRLRISIGICVFGSVAADAGVVLNAAESASRDARNDERGVCLHVPPKSEHEQIEAALDSALHSALGGDGFEFAFQPIVAVQGGDEALFQCLLRLRQVSGEALAAANFVPFAERRGLAAPVDQWAAAAAIRLIAERNAAGRPVRLFLTQSPVSLASADYERWLESQLQAQPLPQESLVIELRLEQAAIHAETISEFCGVLVRRGIGFCLSQFEAGSDAYSLLDRLPLSYLKLGPRYLKAASVGAIKDELQAVVAAAHRRGIQVIAHRVEDPQAAAALWMVGIDLLQGNLVQGVGGGLDFDFRSAVL